MLEPRNDAFWEQKSPPDAFHIENALSYDLFSYILNHSNGSIKVISANIFILKVTLETLEKCIKISSKLCTELSVNLGNSICLNFLDCRAEMCIHLYEEFLCQYEFQLSFLDNMKSLKQSPGNSCILILSLTLTHKLRSTWSY